MDVLADLLEVTRWGTTTIAQAELVAPWGLEIDPQAEAHVHAVLRGSCWLRMAGEERHVRLGEGDLVLIRGGVGHVLCDDPRTPPAPHREVLEGMPRRLAALPAAAVRDTTLVLCAKYLLQDVGPRPLTGLLPPLVHLPAQDAAGHEALSLLLQLLRREAIDGGRGSELVVPRLVDSLLVLVVRAWLRGQPVEAGGWFGALRDPMTARALALIHAEPHVSWTVASLAQRVAQSRATFSRRFGELVGEPPVAYLTRFRMCLAAKLLLQSELSLSEIAGRVGYETAAAFSKAFRRSHGLSPGQFRAGARIGAHPGAGPRGLAT